MGRGLSCKVDDLDLHSYFLRLRRPSTFGRPVALPLSVMPPTPLTPHRFVSLYFTAQTDLGGAAGVSCQVAESGIMTEKHSYLLQPRRIAARLRGGFGGDFPTKWLQTL